jgi:hypothetical protein
MAIIFFDREQHKELIEQYYQRCLTAELTPGLFTLLYARNAEISLQAVECPSAIITEISERATADAAVERLTQLPPLVE